MLSRRQQVGRPRTTIGVRDRSKINKGERSRGKSWAHAFPRLWRLLPPPQTTEGTCSIDIAHLKLTPRTIGQHIPARGRETDNSVLLLVLVASSCFVCVTIISLPPPKPTTELAIR